jgi:lysyl-tRNA synthetase class 2
LPHTTPQRSLDGRLVIVRVISVATVSLGLVVATAGERQWASVPLVARLAVPTSLTDHRLAAMIIGIQFVVLGRGVLLQRWLAHRALAVVVFVGALVNAVGSHPHRVLALTGLAIGVVLVATRDASPVEPDAGRVQPALVAALGIVVTMAGATTAWVWWRHPATGGRPALGHAVRAAGGALVGADGGLTHLAGGTGRLGDLLLASTALIVLAVSVVILAPHAGPEVDAADWRQAEALAGAPSADGLTPFALRHDKVYAFSPDGRAAIGYRVVSGVALFGGDPVGDPAAFDEAVESFLEKCHESGWRPAGIGARGDRAHLWRARGLVTIGIGDEAAVDPREFRLDTPRMRNVRQAVQRSRNFGVTTEIRREGEVPSAERAGLLALAHRLWGGEGERGFSMNLDHVLTGDWPECVVVTARDADGNAVGFQRFAPTGGGRVLSLDTMVRSHDAPNGVNERMIVDVIEWARARGTTWVSMNFAAFRTLFETEDRTIVERVGYWGAHRLDRYIKVESLYRFNNKFRPEWVPRSVVLRSWVDLGWVALAAVQAEFGLEIPFGSAALARRSREILRSLPRAGR